jgi:hypothetical protein
MNALKKIRRALPALLLGALITASCAGIAPEPVLTEGEGTEEGQGKAGFPAESLTESNECYDIRVAYPFFGRPAIDQDLRRRMEDLLRHAAGKFLASCRENPEKSGPENSFIADYVLFGTPQTITVLFSKFTDSGGAHGFTDLESITWSVFGGGELGYADIFAHTDGLWEFLADYAQRELRPKLGELWLAAPEFASGLAPAETSFRRFALTPEGLSLFFPPYQVAPYACGPQRCDIPLEELLRFRPRPGIWQAAP